MNDHIDYKNNPLHGLGLKALLTELVEHYGFNILYAYMNINCFKTNPSIDSSIKFLKKTDWAREKVEAFYLYQFKSLPRASSEQFELPPRDRVIPEGDKPGEPAQLSLEDAEQLREKRAKKAADFDKNGGRSGLGRSSAKKTFDQRKKPATRAPASADPWANWKDKH
ncbi:VF530 family DNA-binding protein [Marinagarivorans algicola]|uniref:VF530 family protein n=1 Tax=Marinagarivorans algicola TaxID=1513270 RepID=UPI0006B4244C|nr:VF530 family DNA-binding protein [Marinagarivorans algicola]